jgi:hypothetical protein
MLFIKIHFPSSPARTPCKATNLLNTVSSRGLAVQKNCSLHGLLLLVGRVCTMEVLLLPLLCAWKLHLAGVLQL